MKRAIALMLVFSLLVFGLSSIAVAEQGIFDTEELSEKVGSGFGEYISENAGEPDPQEDEVGLNMLAPCDYRGCDKIEDGS